LEDLYQGQAEEVAVELAHHFEEAGLTEKAVRYRLLAGQRDMRNSANQEAIDHFNRGLELLATLPETEERDRLEFALQTGLGGPLMATKGYAAPEVGRALTRVVGLVQAMDESPELARLRPMMQQYYCVGAQFRTALDFAQQMLEAAERGGYTPAYPFDRLSMAMDLFYLGDFKAARPHLEATVALWDSEKHQSWVLYTGQHNGVIAHNFLSWTLWLLGYPDQARELSRVAVDMAKELDHAYSLAFALCLGGWLCAWRRDEPDEILEWGNALGEVTEQHGFAFLGAAAPGLRGCAHVRMGEVEQGEAELRQGMADWLATGAVFHQPVWLAWLSDACAASGRVEEGLDLLAQAVDYMERTDGRHFEVEVHRRAGDLQLQQGDEAAAEAGYRKAIVVARRQKAKSQELRAILGLSRLLQLQGKREEAREMLAEIYGWFTEGFDTADLIEAKELLEEL
jgi:tetratricopeptide (TPR) repeat protein